MMEMIVACKCKGGRGYCGTHHHVHICPRVKEGVRALQHGFHERLAALWCW